MKRNEMPLRLCVLATILAFLWLNWRVGVLQGRQDRLERQMQPVAALESKLPMTITVYVSPELGRPRRMNASLPGLPGWAEPQVRAGLPQPPR